MRRRVRGKSRGEGVEAWGSLLRMCWGWGSQGGGPREDAAFPEVAAEDDLDGSGEGDGEERAEETADEEGPEEDGEDDGERVEPDGIADDARGGDEGIDLLDEDEDAADDERVGPDLFDACEAVEERAVWGCLREVGDGDGDGGEPAEEIADVGDEAEDGDEDPDEEGVGEADEGETDADEEPVDETDEHLAAEEGDEVAVDFAERVDEFGFEL